MTEQEERAPPPLRLRHAKAGQVVCLSYDSIEKRLLSVDTHYGYFDGMKASLCHTLDQKGWKFGEGGWQQLKKDIQE